MGKSANDAQNLLELRLDVGMSIIYSCLSLVVSMVFVLRCVIIIGYQLRLRWDSACSLRIVVFYATQNQFMSIDSMPIKD